MESGIRSNAGGGVKGLVNRVLARNVERVLAIPGRKLYARYERASRDPEAAQRAVLAEIVSVAADTVFGREHGLGAVRSVEDFRSKVPVRDYEGHRPYVERHAKGEEGVLFPGKPLMYTRTSGTTALPKLIPISPYNFERTIKNRGKLWLYGLSRHFPGIYSGQDFTIVSPAVEGITEGGTPYGSLSGLIYKNIPEFVKLVHTVPYDVITIKDYDAKAYCLLRLGVPADVTAIFTGNPATVLNLATKADLWKEEIIRDVRDGALRPGLDIEPHIRRAIEERLSPCAERARELDRIASSAGGFRPAAYWPNLKLVHTWTNGNCALVLPKLRPWFREGTPVLDFGYIASEITAADLIDPATNGSLLALLSGFYEFSRVEEEDAADRRFLMAHELEVGARYYVYVTTFSGLFRYDMNDIVEVVGAHNRGPILKFLFKGKGVTSIQGEKVSEAQFIEAVRRAAEKSAVRCDFFVGYANPERDLYELYVELLGETDAADRARFGAAVDAMLREINVEYDAKRHSERLKPIEVIPLGAEAFQRYRALRLAEGAHEGQLKWLHLSSTSVDRERMKRLSEPPS
ncbi:MAG: GH3 auxin-responsive promoter family protein [Proteobacteria bacterium]|nr:GH3 auxin-responsive promoter family protein [Pseudomonadota bacterium]